MSNNVFGQGFSGSILESSNNAFGTEFEAASSNAFGIKPFEDNFPTEFNPSDLTGCVLWLDAADTTKIDASSPANEVIKWHNKGSLAGYFQNSAQPVYTNTHTLNSRNVIYFPPYSTLVTDASGLTLDFQARTVFITTHHLSNPAESIMPYFGYIMGTANADLMSTLSSYNAGTASTSYYMVRTGYLDGIIGSLNINNYDTIQVICFAQDSNTPPDGNLLSINGNTITPLGTSDPATSYYTSAEAYSLNNEGYGTSQDMAEIIIYNRLLSPIERELVQQYLINKWV